MLKSCLRESAISLPEEKLDDLTLALFESADKDNSGAITFEELKAELETFPEVMENLTIRSSITNTFLEKLMLHQNRVSETRGDILSSSCGYYLDFVLRFSLTFSILVVRNNRN